MCLYCMLESIQFRNVLNTQWGLIPQYGSSLHEWSITIILRLTPWHIKKDCLPYANATILLDIQGSNHSKFWQCCQFCCHGGNLKMWPTLRNACIHCHSVWHHSTNTHIRAHIFIVSSCCLISTPIDAQFVDMFLARKQVSRKTTGPILLKFISKVSLRMAVDRIRFWLLYYHFCCHGGNFKLLATFFCKQVSGKTTGPILLKLKSKV